MSTGYVVYHVSADGDEPEASLVSVVWEQDEADELVRRLNAVDPGADGRWAWREIWVHPEPARRDGYLTASDRDRLLLARAHEALGTPRPIAVFFSFPFDREAAIAAATELLRLGWSNAGVDEASADEGLWHVYAQGRRLTVTRESIARLRLDMERLAARHGGEYAGWDVSGARGLRAPVGELAD